EVCAALDHVRGHRYIDAESPQRGIGVLEVVRCRVAGGPGLVHGLVERPHGHTQVWQLTERPGQLGDVHAGAPIDVGRVLTGQDVDAHAPHASPCRPKPRWALGWVTWWRQREG